MFNRASIPEEFFDLTSAKLLVAPEPQYLYAILAKTALGMSLTTPGAIGFMPDRAVGGEGAPYADLMGDRLKLDDPISTQAINVVPEIGKGPGHTVRMNRPKFTDTTYTLASRTIVSNQQISTTPVDVGSEQVAVTVIRMAGPYDQTNSRVAPYSLDKLDSKLSVHNMADIAGFHLRRDYDKTINGIVTDLFDLGSTSVYPTGFSVDNDITATGAAKADFEWISRVEKTLDTANIPYFANGRRVAVLTTQQIHDLKQDAQFVRLAEFHPPVNPLLSATYYKTIGNLDVYRSNTLNSSSNSSSVTVEKGHAFGPGAVGIGIGGLPECRFNVQDNYGEQGLVIWMQYAGFSMLDSRFVTLCKTG